MSPLERMVAEGEIARLITRYAHLNDAGDYPALEEMFTDDAVFVRPSGGEPVVGRAAILASFLARPPRISRHLVSGVLVDLVAPDAARCRSTVLLYTASQSELRPAAADGGLIGGFEDRLVRTEGGWLFAERRGWIDLILGGV